MSSMSARSSCSKLGLITNSPSIRATRTSLMGPLNGMSLTAIAADAARPAKASGISMPSAEYMVMFTKVSA